jgi:hypothetical protein
MKIGLVPMSAKPYHAGHHALVTSAAGENDSVILYVSTTDRTRKGETPIKGSDMYSVWIEQIEGILPANVSTVYGGSPVRKVYDELVNAEETDATDTFTVYSDPVDTAQNFPEANRIKYFPSIYKSGRVVFAAEKDPRAFTRGLGTPDVSGTSVRRSLGQCDYEAFAAAMPTGLDVEAVFDKLCPAKRNESLVRGYVRGLLVSSH